MTEALARAIVDHLDRDLPRNYRVLAIADPAQIAPWLKDQIPGLRAGAPRLAIVGAGRIYFIEVAAAGAALTEATESFLCWCAAWGTSYCVAGSLDDLRAALAHWRLTTGPADLGGDLGAGRSGDDA